MPTVSAHVARTLAAHIDHVFGVMGNGNAWFLDALDRTTTQLYRHAPRGRRRRRRRRALPRVGPARGRDRDLRRRLHQHAHAARRGRPGAGAAGARRRRRADDGPAPVGRRPDRDGLGRRRAHVHGRPSGRRGHDGARDRARAGLPGRRPCSRSPTTSPPSAAGAGARLGPATPRAARRRCAPTRPRSPPAPSPTVATRRSRTRRAPAAARRARRLARRRGRGARRARRGDGRAHRYDGARARRVPRRRFDLGVAGGFGAEGAMRLVREADVAVVFGASLNQFTMRFGELFAPGTRVVQVDIAAAATHPHVGGFVRGDAGVVARALVDRARRARRRAVAAGASRSTSPRPARTSPATASRPTVASTPAASAPASASCCPRIAWSSPTAATSSAGRTCTGPSRRPTA